LGNWDSMFERFTERARQVPVLAQEEARTLKHHYIGTEHILLGLLREEEGHAARVLESLDITVERVRAQVMRIVGSGEEVTAGRIPFTPRAQKVLELALREALSLGHNYVGTEHILLGLVRENEGVAARILLDFDADSEKIHNKVIGMLSGPGVTGSATSEPIAVGHEESSDVVYEPPATSIDADLGWRGRPMALAALGAAVLARTAFDRSKTGVLEPLEMQLLARLTLGPKDGALAEPGERFESLTVALACDADDLREAIHALEDRRLIVCSAEQDGDERVSITAAGISSVRAWLRHAIPLFGQWPPAHAAADDAVS
jgi:Clp amino terminal domain, pathogenicity island component